MDDTGDILRRYRDVVGISQVELARRVGCGKAMMSQIESGIRSPSPALAGRLQEVTGIDARILLGIPAGWA